MMLRRKLKNAVNNYTEAEIKVREVTSNDPWGPSSTLMAELSDQTHNPVIFAEIMSMVWRRLNDKNRNWRHVYKALLLLEYMIKTGNPRVAQQCKENIHAIQTLRDFQYVEEGKDHGLSVREKAKSLVALLKDDDLLQTEREKGLVAKKRFTSNATGISSHSGHRYRGGGRMRQGTSMSDLATASAYGAAGQSSRNEFQRPRNEGTSARPRSMGEEEIQFQIALAISREEAEAEKKKRAEEAAAEEVKIRMALEESKKEDEAYRRRYNATGNGDLFSLEAPPSSQSDPWSTSNRNAFGDPWSASSETKASNQFDPWTSPGATSGVPAIAGPPSFTGSSAKKDPWKSDGFNTNNANLTNGTTKTSSAKGAMADLEFLDISSSTNANNSAGGDPDEEIYGMAWGIPSNSSDRSYSRGMSASQNDLESLSSWHVTGTTAIDDMGLFGESSTDPVPVFTESPLKPAGANRLGMSSSASVGDLLGGGSSNSNSTGCKDPLNFLGENSKLVNLENLVTKPKNESDDDSTNPFATSVPSKQVNPFAAIQPPKVPISQLNASSSAAPNQHSATQFQANFGQTPGLPAPLLPITGPNAGQSNFALSNQERPAYQAQANPFL